MANTRLIKVHKDFVRVADNYRKEFEKRIGVPIQRTKVSKQMAQVFEKMLDVNGFPTIRTNEKKVGRRKINTVHVFWEFDI